ncbi:hypothetical protein EH223_03080 [candidate division KSB1 bacterium]|nr:hypothetical protein [candidate division KSB1 bacterium]RQW06125.1 MAG: hypothetical protein EH223_03080 [candidate division KSB1 bacterium]
MTFRNRITVIYFVSLLLSLKLCAFSARHETGPIHVGSAWNIYKGGLYVLGQGRFYSATDKVSKNRQESEVIVWDSQLSATLYWGMTHHWQLGFTPILSQKHHLEDPPQDSDSPGDMLLHVKFGSVGPRKAPFRLAVQFDVRLPVAEHHNIPLHPYSADALGYGAMGLLSLARPSQPDYGFAWHLNAGWFTHNDKGLTISNKENDPVTVQSPTQEMLFGSQARLKGKKLGLFAEVYGCYFLQEPPETAYTRENYVYFTPGIIYQFNPYIQVFASADLMLQGWQDKTAYESENGASVEKQWDNLPNMPNWRFNFGLSFRLKEGKPPAAPAAETATPATTEVPEEENKRDKETRKQRENDLKELEQQLKDRDSQQIIENDEEREQRIQAERQRMLEILQRLREAMENEEKEESEQNRSTVPEE